LNEADTTKALGERTQKYKDDTAELRAKIAKADADLNKAQKMKESQEARYKGPEAVDAMKKKKNSGYTDEWDKELMSRSPQDRVNEINGLQSDFNKATKEFASDLTAIAKSAKDVGANYQKQLDALTTALGEVKSYRYNSTAKGYFGKTDVANRRVTLSPLVFAASSAQMIGTMFHEGEHARYQNADDSLDVAEHVAITNHQAALTKELMGEVTEANKTNIQAYLGAFLQSKGLTNTPSTLEIGGQYGNITP